MKKSPLVTRFYASAVGALLLTAGTVQAGVENEFLKLFARDADAMDFFGISVAISGTTAIVGAALDDDNGFNSGSAYLFDTTTGLPGRKLLANDGEPNDQFGESVAISGTTAIIGAWQDGDNGNRSGSAYLFDTTTGLQVAKLLPNDGDSDDRFGLSVAISGTTAIVGAFFNDDNGSNSGSAYLFDATTGLQITKLLPNDGAEGDFFGSSVAVSGTTAIVGASADDDNGSDSGSAYLFDTTTGLQIAKLLSNDGDAGDSLGFEVAISGAIAIVSAYGDDDNGPGSGSAYLFDTDTGLQLFKLLPDDGEQNKRFGESVAISGTIAIVGSSMNDDNGTDSGSAYLFDTKTGLQLAKLLPRDGDSGDRFGVFVSTSETTAIVGAFSDEEKANSAGSAYLFYTSPPSLVSDVSSISLSSGGVQSLSLEGGRNHAGWTYRMLGSASGGAPGLDLGGGVLLPLNFDAYFNLTLVHSGAGIFDEFKGVLDGNGQAVATLMLPVLEDPSLAGITLTHAYLAFAGGGGTYFASNALPLLLVP